MLTGLQTLILMDRVCILQALWAYFHRRTGMNKADFSR